MEIKSVAMILFVILASAFILFSYSPKGFVDVRTGFLLRVSGILGFFGSKEENRDVIKRRARTISDISVVAKKYEGVRVLDATVDKNIPVRMYTANEESEKPLILYFHGGGYVLGNLDYADNICKALALQTAANVISVDYRLAPEHPYPAALEDAEKVLAWLEDGGSGGSEFTFDPDRIFVMGDSAGGNLAAVLSLKVRDSGNTNLIRGQILLYPVTDFSGMETDSYRLYDKSYMLTKSDMEWFRDLYVPAVSDRTDPYVSPLLADGFSDLPKAMIICAEYDVLRDEGKAYADKLASDGNTVSYTVMKGTVHGFLSMDAYLDQPKKVYAMIRTFIGNE